jgi:transcriptional regulator with XRE-family HTH domain
MGHQLMMTEAGILRDAREKLGLTQQQVADKARIQLRQYQRFEGGERNLTSSSFNIACNVLEALQLDIAGFRRGAYSLSEEFETIGEVLAFANRHSHE